MGVGRKCCEGYLQLMNSLVMLIGFAVIGIALYLIIDQDSSFMLTIGSTGPWVQYTTLSLGIVVVIFASVGCCLVDSYSKCRLSFYGILLFFIGAIIVLAGAASILYKNYSITIATASIASQYELIPAGLAETQQYLARLVYLTFLSILYLQKKSFLVHTFSTQN